jgi:hypothetical protein
MIFFLLLLIPIPPAAQAGILSLDKSDKIFEGVALGDKATLAFGGKAFRMGSLGSGLRYKKVVFIKANVYVGQLFSSEPEKFVRSATGALDSLEAASAVAMRMTFLRTVGAITLAKAFREAFEKNAVPVGEGPVKAFLEAVKGASPAEESKTVVVAASRSGDSETLVYEDAKGKSFQVRGPLGTIKKIFSAWLGVPVDSGVESLKRQLIDQ